MKVFRLVAKASAITATVAMMLEAGQVNAQHRASNLASVAMAACTRLNSAASLNDIDSVLNQMAAQEFLLLRNASNEARANHQASIFGAVGLENQNQIWFREREGKQRDLNNIRAHGGPGRDSDPAVAIAIADIARLQTVKAERNTLAEAARLAMHELAVRNAAGSGDLGSGTTIDLATLEENVFRTTTALEDHVAQSGLATMADIDAAIMRRTTERAALQTSFDGVRASNLEREIAALTSQIAQSVGSIVHLRNEAESYRLDMWAYYNVEQAIHNCAIQRGRALGASGTPPGVGRPPAVIQQQQVPTATTPSVSQPPVQAAGTMPTATWFETQSAFAAPNDSSGSYLGQSIRIDLKYYDDGSVTGSMKNYGGTVLGSLSGRWSGGTARGRISLADDVLRVPGSGGGGSWEINFPPPGVGRPSGAWCIISSGADRRVARQFGMIYLANFPVVMQRYTTDTFCK